jgi:hypothetical protein
LDYQVIKANFGLKRVVKFYLTGKLSNAEFAYWYKFYWDMLPNPFLVSSSYSSHRSYKSGNLNPQ